MGPIALPPELIENGPQFLEIEFPGLPGINELSLESYTIQYKHTNDNNLLNKTEIIKTSARPLKRLFRGLEYNTTYSFKYKVEDKDGESDYSPWVDFSTTARGKNLIFKIKLSFFHILEHHVLTPQMSVLNKN